MSLKNLFVVWFLLFTFAAGTSWAATDHGPASDSGQQSGDIGHHQVPAWADDGCSDHCDHVGAHFVALLSLSVATFLTPAAHMASFDTTRPASRQPSPPFDPPIA